MRCLIAAGALLATALCAGAGAGAATLDVDPSAVRDATACSSGVALSTGAAVARSLPTVVRVIALRVGRRDAPAEEGPSQFMPLQDREGSSRSGATERVAASGFLLSADGLVVSSAHAVRGAAEIWVVPADGTPRRARLLGEESRADVALLAIDGDGYAAVELAGQDPTPGEWVAAIGAPFGFEQSISAGVVSAFPRVLAGSNGVPLVQTDVALNPGSSGGPLLNACGQLVGMNSMIFSASGIYIGVSFAVPVTRVLRSVAALRGGPVERGQLGVRTQTVTAALAQAFGLRQPAGALLVGVASGSAAAEAGLREGDIVLALDGQPVASSEEFEDGLARSPPQTVVALDLLRDGAIDRVQARLRGRPPTQVLGAAPVSAEQRSARLGLALASPSAADGLPPGAYVRSARGAALVAGLEEGDRIAAVNGRAISTPAEFEQAVDLALAQQRPVVALLVVRDGVPWYLPVRAGPP